MMMILHCLQKGPYFKDLVLNKNLFGILGPFWVLISKLGGPY